MIKRKRNVGEMAKAKEENDLINDCGSWESLPCFIYFHFDKNEFLFSLMFSAFGLSREHSCKVGGLSDARVQWKPGWHRL